MKITFNIKQNIKITKITKINILKKYEDHSNTINYIYIYIITYII